MTIKRDLGAALRAIRLHRHIPQESLGPSQSFISDLERGIRSPTLVKFEQLASLLGISPVTLLVYTYSQQGQTTEDLLDTARRELSELGK